MINIATASRSDIIIIVRLLLLLLFHINNIYMEYPYMREILYATGHNKEKKKEFAGAIAPVTVLFFLLDDYSAERIFKRFSTYSLALSSNPVGTDR